jgi:hypothetical protein
VAVLQHSDRDPLNQIAITLDVPRESAVKCRCNRSKCQIKIKKQRVSGQCEFRTDRETAKPLAGFPALKAPQHASPGQRPGLPVPPNVARPERAWESPSALSGRMTLCVRDSRGVAPGWHAPRRWRGTLDYPSENRTAHIRPMDSSCTMPSEMFLQRPQKLAGLRPLARLVANG